MLMGGSIILDWIILFIGKRSNVLIIMIWLSWFSSSIPMKFPIASGSTFEANSSGYIMMMKYGSLNCDSYIC